MREEIEREILLAKENAVTNNVCGGGGHFVMAQEEANL